MAGLAPPRSRAGIARLTQTADATSLQIIRDFSVAITLLPFAHWNQDRSGEDRIAKLHSPFWKGVTSRRAGGQPLGRKAKLPGVALASRASKATPGGHCLKCPGRLPGFMKWQWGWCQCVSGPCAISWEYSVIILPARGLGTGPTSEQNHPLLSQQASISHGHVEPNPTSACRTDVCLYDLRLANGLRGVMNIITLGRNVINRQHCPCFMYLRKTKQTKKALHNLKWFTK